MSELQQVVDLRAEADEFDRLLGENARYAESFDRSALTAAPLRRLAILACMDARLDVEAVLGLRPGEAHIIRNAGGLATEDAVRSLIVLDSYGTNACDPTPRPLMGQPLILLGPPAKYCLKKGSVVSVFPIGMPTPPKMRKTKASFL